MSDLLYKKIRNAIIVFAYVLHTCFPFRTHADVSFFNIPRAPEVHQINVTFSSDISFRWIPYDSSGKLAVGDIVVFKAPDGNMYSAEVQGVGSDNYIHIGEFYPYETSGEQGTPTIGNGDGATQVTVPENSNSPSSPSDAGDVNNSAGYGGASFGSMMSGAVQSGGMAGGIAAASVGLYRLIVMSHGEQARFEAVQKEIEAIAKENKATIDDINKRRAELEKEFTSEIKNFLKTPQAGKIGAVVDSYELKSPDGVFKNDIKTIRKVLNQITPVQEHRVEAKQIGLEFTEYADTAFSEGEYVDANFYKNAAVQFADIAVGLDPVSGFGRDIYEAFTGKNLITGETLTDLERSFAVVGSLSLGFGSSIKNGIKALSKVAHVAYKGFDKSLNLATATVKHWDKMPFRDVIRSSHTMREAYYHSKMLVEIAASEYPENLLGVSKLINYGFNKVATNGIALGKMGDKFVQKLPDITDTNILKAFHKSKMYQVTLQPGDILMRVQDSTREVGAWFGKAVPNTVTHAEDLFKIKGFSPRIDKVDVYLVKDKAAVWFGKVDGGMGTQYYFPEEVYKDRSYLELLHKIDEIDLIR